MDTVERNVKGGNKLNIDEMQAGRGMDCQIALKVMGWTEAGWDCDMHEYNGVPDNGANGVLYIVPHYSTEISAAWEVIKKTRQIDKHWTPTIYWDDGDGIADGCWVCSFAYYGKTEGQYRNYAAYADTAPLAICCAALKALGVDI